MTIKITTRNISSTGAGNFKVITRNYLSETIYTRQVKYGFKTREEAQTHIAKQVEKECQKKELRAGTTL